MKRVVHTSAKVTLSERKAIDAFLSKQAALRFAYADSATDWNMCCFLRTQGYTVQCQSPYGAKHGTFQINGKTYTRVKFIAFVNRVRAKVGKPSIGSRP